MTADVRKGMPDPHLTKEVFRSRFLSRFRDPGFDGLRAGLDQAAEIAWEACEEARKAPLTQPAGPEFSDPAYQMSVEWLAARDAIRVAEARHRDRELPAHILIINGSPRSEHTCPG